MKKYLVFLCVTVSVFVGITGIAKATLIDRGGGLIYDEALNITWLQDANYAKTSGYDADGSMNYYAASTWVSNLVFQGYDDWYIPAPGFTAIIPNQVNADGMMGHLYHDEGVTASTPGLFTNLNGAGCYWAGAYPIYSSVAWVFTFAEGYYGNSVYGYDSGVRFTMAYRVGDSTPIDTPAVPEPTTMLLLGSGLICLVGARRKSKK